MSTPEDRARWRLRAERSDKYAQALTTQLRFFPDDPVRARAEAHMFLTRLYWKRFRELVQMERERERSEERSGSDGERLMSAAWWAPARG